MVRLYRWNPNEKSWVLADYGIESKTDVYTKLGYVVRPALIRNPNKALLKAA
jgi:hypothetical protein